MESLEEIIRLRLKGMCDSEHGLQKKLAEKAQVTPQYFNKVLSGKETLTRKSILALSEKLNIDLYGDAIRHLKAPEVIEPDTLSQEERIATAVAEKLGAMLQPISPAAPLLTPEQEVALREYPLILRKLGREGIEALLRCDDEIQVAIAIDSLKHDPKAYYQNQKNQTAETAQAKDSKAPSVHHHQKKKAL